jgi:peroxiredoxin
MKLSLLILVLFCIQSYGQVISTTISERIEGKVFNKKTGKKITDEELVEIITSNPGIAFEEVYDKYGKLEKLYYDPDRARAARHQSQRRNHQMKKGEKFPAFVFRTVDNEVLDSEKLTGKWILIRFELFTRFMIREEVDSWSQQIEKAQTGNNLVPIICLADSRQNINDEFDSDRLPFKLVSDAGNFHKRFKIVNFPTSILIDREGMVFKYYYLGDNIPFDELMKN